MFEKQRTRNSNAEIVKRSGAIKPARCFDQLFSNYGCQLILKQKIFWSLDINDIAIENDGLKHGKCWCKQSSVVDFTKNCVKVLDFGASHVSNSTAFRRYKFCVVSILSCASASAWLCYVDTACLLLVICQQVGWVALWKCLPPPGCLLVKENMLDGSPVFS